MLQLVLTDLIEHHGVNAFYVGNQGNFDKMVIFLLKSLKQKYPHITYAVVLAYLPKGHISLDLDAQDFSTTIFPEGIEKVPKRFAICWRNKWMIRQSDIVVTWVVRDGGAARFESLAERQGKRLIKLYKG